MVEKPATTPEREQFYARIRHSDLAPLWEVFGDLITPAPASACVPAYWNYEEVLPFIMESGELITAAEAERRVLVFENPGLKGQAKVTTSLYAGLQLVLPGEVAPAHRHSQSALRFIVDGEGAYTAVGGEKTVMHEGDFVITPGWAWHDHGNDSDQPVVWLDGLDIPIVQFFDASFFESHNADRHQLNRGEGYSLARYGSGLLPDGFSHDRADSPLFSYPYARTREALETMKREEEWDPVQGLRLYYANPATGGHAMATIGAFVQLLPKGFQTVPYRSTDATVFSVVDGYGKTVIGEVAFDWGPRDTFVIPSWASHYHEAEDEAVLFSFSDRPVQEALGLWREDRGGR